MPRQARKPCSGCGLAFRICSHSAAAPSNTKTQLPGQAFGLSGMTSPGERIDLNPYDSTLLKIPDRTGANDRRKFFRPSLHPDAEARRNP